jgi:L-cysteine desulfidase
MITETERKRIIDLIHQEVVPAIGCTEPIAVANINANDLLR